MSRPEVGVVRGAGEVVGAGLGVGVGLDVVAMQVAYMLVIVFWYPAGVPNVDEYSAK